MSDPPRGGRRPAANAGDGAAQKASRRSLIIERERYKQLFESITDAALVIDQATGRILEANEAAIDVFGYTRGELLELTDLDLAAETGQATEQTPRRGDVQSWTIHADRRLFRRKDATVFAAEISARVFPSKGCLVRLKIVKDISDRERAAQELQKSEARLHQALAAARAGTWEWDLVTGLNSWSKEIWDLYDLDAQSGSPSYEAWLASIVPDDRSAAAATVTGAAERREPFYAEWRVATRDGSQRWLGSHGSPKLDDTGKAVRYLGVVIDITRRKLAEDAVHVGDAQRAAAFDSLGDAILITDAQGALVHFNEAWVTFCRFADRDDCPAAFDEYHGLFRVFQATGEPVPDSEWAVPRALRGEAATDQVYRFRRTGTGKEWMGSCSFAPVLELDGHVCGAVVVARDVTEQKSTERALRESEQRHRTLFESMPHGVVYHAADGRITDANPAAQRILGLTLDQLQGRAPTDPRWRAVREGWATFASEDHPASVALATGQEVRNVVMGVFNPADETYRWITIDAVPQFRPGEDRPYQVYTTFDDITGRREAAVRPST